MEGAWFQSLEGDEEVSVLNLLNLSKPRQNRLYNGTLHDSDPRHSLRQSSPSASDFCRFKGCHCQSFKESISCQKSADPGTKDHKGSQRLKTSGKKKNLRKSSRHGHDGHGTYWHLQTVEQENGPSSRAESWPRPALHKQCGFLMFHPFLVFSFRK